MLSTVTRLRRWFKASQNTTLASASVDLHVARDEPLAPPASVVNTDAFPERLSVEIDGDCEASTLATSVSLGFRRVLMLDVDLPRALLELEGMSGKKYRLFINTLVGAVKGARYLEVGSGTGSTACSAMYGNDATVVCIDPRLGIGNPREIFFENINKYLNAANITVFEKETDCVDYSMIGKFNIVASGGSHQHDDRGLGLELMTEALDDEFVLSVDDWNVRSVRERTMNAIRALPLDCLYEIAIRTTLNDEHAGVAHQDSDWHNGYYLAVYRKLGATGRADSFT
jgi:hypothetical protein